MRCLISRLICLSTNAMTQVQGYWFANQIYLQIKFNITFVRTQGKQNWLFPFDFGFLEARFASCGCPSLEQFSFKLSVVKPVLKKLLQPITTDRNSAISQSEFEAMIRNRRKARKNVRVQVAIGFASHWLRKRHEFCWPITERSKAKPEQARFTFDVQSRNGLSEIDFVTRAWFWTLV